MICPLSPPYKLYLLSYADLEARFLRYFFSCVDLVWEDNQIMILALLVNA